MRIPDEVGAHLPRRRFLATMAATIAGMTGLDGLQPAPRKTAQEPWGRLEPVGPDAWALVSTPLVGGDAARRTLCNGGIVAGRDGVLAVEGFASDEGAAWLSAEAERLTGMRPTHVVLTHFHGDHTTGTAGYLHGGGDVRVMATGTTRRILVEREARLPAESPTARQLLLPGTLLAEEREPTELDLGGRTVRLHALGGHTPSDLIVEIEGVIWAGDLVWNGMFPNYVDASPSHLSASVRRLRAMGATTYVPGHGELASPADLDTYLDLLDHVEAAARRAIVAGRPLDRAGAEYRVPERLGAWHMFSPRYPEVSFRAWARDVENAAPAPTP